MAHSGGCLCGAVRYAVDGPLREILICHCVECRRWAGRAWPATAALDADLEIPAGGALSWAPSPRSEHRAERGSCSRCGTSLFWRVPGRDRVSIAAGTLDDPAGLVVAAHIWVDHAVDWDRPPAGVPAYPRGYPETAPPLLWA